MSIFCSQPFQVIIRLANFVDVTTQARDEVSNARRFTTAVDVIHVQLYTKFAVSGASGLEVLLRTSRAPACTRWQQRAAPNVVQSGVSCATQCLGLNPVPLAWHGTLAAHRP